MDLWRPSREEALVTFGGAEVGGNIVILVPEGERTYNRNNTI